MPQYYMYSRNYIPHITRINNFQQVKVNMPLAQHADRSSYNCFPVEKKSPISHRAPICAALKGVRSYIQPSTQTQVFSLDKRIGDRLNKMNEYSFILTSLFQQTKEGVLN
jgi:hypothetical protein